MPQTQMTEQNWEDWQENDKLQRVTNIIGFGNILLADKENEVFSLTAPFGFGKTFFCEGLKAYLKVQGAKGILYNAWKSDFFDNPLIPIISEIGETFKESPTLVEDLKNKGKILLKSFSLNLSVIGINPSASLESTDIFSEYQTYLSAINDVKSALHSIVCDETKPLIIIIDELDRCRPDYAVKTLEMIKHFFDIDGVKFVISIDEEQIKKSVKQLYGTDNFDGYIRKFVNYRFSLPEASKEGYINAVFDTLRYPRTDPAIDSVIAWSYFFGFSFRAINHVIGRLKLRAKKNIMSFALSATLACFYEFNKDFYESIKRGEDYDFEDLKNLAKTLKEKGWLTSEYSERAELIYNNIIRYYGERGSIIKQYSKNNSDFDLWIRPEAEEIEMITVF